MLPVLLDIKIFKIYTFGVFLLLAFLWGMFFLWRAVKLTSYKEEDIFDSLFIGLFWGLLFSRITYVALNFSDFGFDILKFILINGYPGLSIYGGIFGSIVALYIHFSYKKINFLKVIDYFIPGLFVATAVAKIGSFLGGIDVGTKTNLWVAVNYSGYQGARHITALYESAFFFVGAFLVHRIIMSIRRHTLPHGFAFWFFIFYFALVNLFLDKLKENRLYLGTFDVNFMISAFLALFVGLYIIYCLRDRIFNYGKNTGQKNNKNTSGQTGKPGKKS